MGTVLILSWSGSIYDVIRGLLALAADELRAEGHEVETVTLGEPGWEDALGARLNKGGVAFALGMIGTGSDLTAQDGRPLWDVVRVPFVNWNCDHPCYYPAQNRIRTPFVRQVYLFPDHAAYAARHLGPATERFAVHFGMPRRDLFAGAPLPLAARNGRLAFFKSGWDPAMTTERWRAMPATVGDLLSEAVEELLPRGVVADVLPTLQRLGERRGLFFDGASRLALKLVKEVDAHIRFVRAGLVLAALRDLPVDVFGIGWSHVDWSGTRAVYGGVLSAAEMIARLPAFLGSVSVNPLVDGSLHDRVTFALAAGVVPVGDANAFWRARLPMLAPYGFGFDRDAIAAAADAVLSDPAAALERTEAAHAALQPGLTLRQSIREIVAIAGIDMTPTPT